MIREPTNVRSSYAKIWRMAVSESRVLLVRHPRSGNLLPASDAHSARLLLTGNTKPLLLLIEMQTAPTGLDGTIELSTVLGLDGAILGSHVVPFLGPTIGSGTSNSLLEARLESTQVMVTLRLTETARLEPAWTAAGGLSAIAYARRLAAVAVSAAPDEPPILVMRAIGRLISQDNRMCLAGESERATAVLSPRAEPGAVDDSILLLWKARQRMRQLHAAFQRRGYSDEVSDVEAIDRVVGDLDSVSQLLMVRSLQSLVLGAAETNRAVNAFRLSTEERESKTQAEIRRVDRRLGSLAAAFLLPGLWLAFWAVPSRSFSRDAPVDLFLVAVAVGTILLFLLGFFTFSTFGKRER